MSTEKRNLQMDLETARIVYQAVKPREGDRWNIGSNPWIFMQLIASAFTIEELEGNDMPKHIDGRNGPLQEYDPTPDKLYDAHKHHDYLFKQSMGFKKEQERGATLEEYNISMDQIKKQFKKDPPPFTLEQAQQTYKDLQAYPKCQSLINLNNLALHWYTKEQIEGKPKNKGFTWEESFKPGYVIDSCPTKLKVIIKKCINRVAQDHFKNQYATEKQALSALAFAQLTHIVAKYNDGKCPAKNKNGDIVNWFIQPHNDGTTTINSCTYFGCIQPLQVFLFNKLEDAQTSAKANQALWKQYWMID